MTTGGRCVGLCGIGRRGVPCRCCRLPLMGVYSGFGSSHPYTPYIGRPAASATHPGGGRAQPDRRAEPACWRPGHGPAGHG